MAPVSVATFGAEGKAAAYNKGVTVRAGTFTPPKGNFWSDYLRETLIAQLQASGNYEANSAIVISGVLVENRSGEGFDDGKAVLSARFEVRRDGASQFSKVVSVETDWDSSFFGFLAYETALRHYTALYPKLIETLAADRDFQAAVAPR